MSLGMKIALGVRVAWALLVLFGLLGFLLGHTQQAMMIIIVSASVWVTLRIVNDGVMAYGLWRDLSRAKKLIDKMTKGKTNGFDQGTPKDEDDPPT